MPLLSRRRWVLAKLEGSSYGVDASPVAADAIQVTNLELTPLAGDVVSRDLIRGYLGASPTLVASEYGVCTIETEITGSGAAGTAPAFGKLLQACAMSATVTGAAVTGTAAAGGSNTITLAAGASSVDSFYNGQILTITSGSGSGSVAQITSYVGSTKVATVAPFDGVAVTYSGTSVYSITANVTYAPITTTEGVSNTSITIYYFIDRVLHSFRGARGTVSFSWGLRQIPKATFAFTGIYVTPTDTSTPAPTYANQATPQIFRSGNAGSYSFLSYSGCLESVSFDVGNAVEYKERVGCSKQVNIVDRSSSGNVVIEAPVMASKNYFTAALDDTLTGSGLLSFVHGTAAGQRISLIAPQVDLGQPSYQDSQGDHMLNLPFTAVPTTAGNDEFRLVFC